MQVQTLCRFLVVVLLSQLSSSRLKADQLEETVTKLASAVLAVTNQKPVRIGVFSPTDLPETNYGMQLSESLKIALNKQTQGIVRDNADFEVKGDFMFARSREHQDLKKVIKLKARIIDLEFGDELQQFSFRSEMTHTDSIAQTIQESVALPPNGSKEERNEALVQCHESPQVHIHGPKRSLVSTSDNSPYAVEILVSPDSRSPASPRTAIVEKGRAFVDIAKKESYEVCIYNTSNQEVAVKVSVDGLNMFHFSKDRDSQGSPLYNHVIIPAKSRETVVGWHNSVTGNENYRSFLVSSYNESALSKTGVKATGSLGVILVEFSNSNTIAEGARSGSGKGTTFGAPRTVHQKPVRREIDVPHEFIAIRYARPVN